MRTDRHTLMIREETAPGKWLGNVPTKNGLREEITSVLRIKKHPQPTVNGGKAQLPLVFHQPQRICWASPASFPFTFSFDFEERATVEPDAMN